MKHINVSQCNYLQNYIPRLLNERKSPSLSASDNERDCLLVNELFTRENTRSEDADEGTTRAVALVELVVMLLLLFCDLSEICFNNWFFVVSRYHFLARTRAVAITRFEPLGRVRPCALYQQAYHQIPPISDLSEKPEWPAILDTRFTFCSTWALATVKRPMSAQHATANFLPPKNDMQNGLFSLFSFLFSLFLYLHLRYVCQPP